MWRDTGHPIHSIPTSDIIQWEDFRTKPSVFTFLEEGGHCIDHLSLLMFFSSIVTQGNCQQSFTSILAALAQVSSNHCIQTHCNNNDWLLHQLNCFKMELSTDIRTVDSPTSYLSFCFFIQICDFLFTAGCSLMQMMMFIIDYFIQQQASR